MSNGMEFPLLGELNLNGVPMSNSPSSSSNTNMNTINSLGNNMNTNMQQHQHMQGMNNTMMMNPNSPQNNGNNPITPSSLWGSALPFSFDALMSGNVALAQAMPLVTHN
jgi:hypothetical protein